MTDRAEIETRVTQGARRTARRRRGTGRARRALRRGPERRLARPGGGRAGPRGGMGHRDPRGRDGADQDRRRGRRPGRRPSSESAEPRRAREAVANAARSSSPGSDRSPRWASAWTTFWAGMTRAATACGRSRVRHLRPARHGGRRGRGLRAGRLPGHEGSSAHRPVRPVRDRRGLAGLGRRGRRPRSSPTRRGVIFATGIGGDPDDAATSTTCCLEKGPGRVSPFMVPMLMANAAAGHIAMRFGLTGPNYGHAVGLRILQPRDRRGHAADPRRVPRPRASPAAPRPPRIPLTVAAFAQMTALTKNPDPETASRPFDADRNGFVLSEGGAALILEIEAHATARGARIYAEVAGYGASDDAHHITAPDPKGSGATLAMRWALRRRRRRAGGRQLHQRPRHLDPAERRRRDGGDQGHPRGGHRAQGRRQLDEVDDGAHARRRRRRGRGRLRARGHERHDPAHRSTTPRPIPTATST